MSDLVGFCWILSDYVEQWNIKMHWTCLFHTLHFGMQFIINKQLKFDNYLNLKFRLNFGGCLKYTTIATWQLKQRYDVPCALIYSNQKHNALSKEFLLNQALLGLRADKGLCRTWSCYVGLGQILSDLVRFVRIWSDLFGLCGTVEHKNALGLPFIPCICYAIYHQQAIKI